MLKSIEQILQLSQNFSNFDDILNQDYGIFISISLDLELTIIIQSLSTLPCTKSTKVLEVCYLTYIVWQSDCTSSFQYLALSNFVETIKKN